MDCITRMRSQRRCGSEITPGAAEIAAKDVDRFPPTRRPPPRPASPLRHAKASFTKMRIEGGGAMALTLNEFEKLYSLKEVEGILGVSRSTVHREIKDGALGYTRVRARKFVAESHIRAYREANERPARLARLGVR